MIKKAMGHLILAALTAFVALAAGGLVMVTIGWQCVYAVAPSWWCSLLLLGLAALWPALFILFARAMFKRQDG